VINKINTDGYIYDVFKSGKYAYMANESNQRLDIVNLTSLENPITEASYQADNKIFGVWKHDVFVFVAANNNTLILRHNSPPVLAPIDSQMVNEQLLLTVKADGYDPDGDQVYFEIKNLPEGASFDSIGGVLTWTPTYDQSGIYENVTVRVIERTATKLYTDQSFVITVNHVNRPPSLPEVENFSIDENGTLTFTISEGSDPDIEDKGRLTYLVENAPQGVQFDSLSRTFTWTPTYEQSGTYVMDFVVNNRRRVKV